MARGTTTLIFNLDAPDAWQRLHATLTEAGCDESSATFVWEQVKTSASGQLDPRTRSKPVPNYNSLERALNAELGPQYRSPEDDLAVVWERAGPLAPRNVRLVIHHEIKSPDADA